MVSDALSVMQAWQSGLQRKWPAAMQMTFSFSTASGELLRSVRGQIQRYFAYEGTDAEGVGSS